MKYDSPLMARIPSELYNEFLNYAKERGMDKSEAVREILTEKFETIESLSKDIEYHKLKIKEKMLSKQIKEEEQKRQQKEEREQEVRERLTQEEIRKKKEFEEKVSNIAKPIFDKIISDKIDDLEKIDEIVESETVNLNPDLKMGVLKKFEGGWKKQIIHLVKQRNTTN